jgi:arylsulfatase A-like enzyme
MRRLAIALGALAALLAGTGCSRDSAPERPNVLLITLDTTRVDHLGAYGYARATSPNLDRLASEAIVYENAYSTSSWTLPAHASLFSGKFPSSHGARRDRDGPLILADAVNAPESTRARGMSPRERTLATLLRAEGYATAGVVAGPWLMRPFGLASGFDSWDDENVVMGGRPAREVTDRALAWLEAEPREPFLLFLNYFEPHAPYAPPAAFAQAFLPPGVRPSTRDARQARDLYDAEILYMDFELGRLLDALRERDLYARTLVVVTADHGELLGEHEQWGHGQALWEPLVRVPLIVKPAGTERAAQRRDERVSLVDVLPLILRELRLDPGETAPRPVVLAELEIAPLHGEALAWRALWEGSFKYLASSRGDGHLFDLSSDPGEGQDLAARQSERATQLARALDQVLAELPPPLEADTEETAIEPRTVEALRALGYLGETPSEPEPDAPPPPSDAPR